jgi:predicted HD superfamily hydrolase involved in NAD metabolism
VIDRSTAEGMVRERLTPRRLEHSLRVAALAEELARRFGAAPEAAAVAGLLHDYCRELPAEPLLAAAGRHGIRVDTVAARRPAGLLHAPVAAAELRAAGLVDAEVAGAIARHTVGGAGMTTLEQILYLADFCEPGRDFPGLDEVRALARDSLAAAVAEAARLSLLDLVERRRGVVPEALALYNEAHAGR